MTKKRTNNYQIKQKNYQYKYNPIILPSINQQIKINNILYYKRYYFHPILVNKNN